MDSVKQQLIHGRTMYIMALEHSINMFELAGDGALESLKTRLDQEKVELQEIEAEACND